MLHLLNFLGFVMVLQQLTLEGKPVEIRPYRHITLKEQTVFCDFLFNFGIFSGIIAKLFWCSSEYMKYDCTHESVLDMLFIHKQSYVNQMSLLQTVYASSSKQ